MPRNRSYPSMGRAFDLTGRREHCRTVHVALLLWRTGRDPSTLVNAAGLRRLAHEKQVRQTTACSTRCCGSGGAMVRLRLVPRQRTMRIGAVEEAGDRVAARAVSRGSCDGVPRLRTAGHVPERSSVATSERLPSWHVRVVDALRRADRADQVPGTCSHRVPPVGDLDARRSGACTGTHSTRSTGSSTTVRRSARSDCEAASRAHGERRALLREARANRRVDRRVRRSLRGPDRPSGARRLGGCRCCYSLALTRRDQGDLDASTNELRDPRAPDGQRVRRAQQLVLSTVTELATNVARTATCRLPSRWRRPAPGRDLPPRPARRDALCCAPRSRAGRSSEGTTTSVGVACGVGPLVDFTRAGCRRAPRRSSCGFLYADALCRGRRRGLRHRAAHLAARRPSCVAVGDVGLHRRRHRRARGVARRPRGRAPRAT